MPVKTLFSGQVIDLLQLRQVFRLIQDWSDAQDKQNWKRHGSFLSFPEGQTTVQFNFFVTGNNGLTQEQIDSVLQLLRDAGLRQLITAIDPRPAS